MVFKRKKGSGATGRPRGSTGESSVNDMDDEQRRGYWRAAKQRERSSATGTDQTVAVPMVPSTPSSGDSTTRRGAVYSPSTSETSETRSVGRPPLHANAMTPTTLKSRKRALYHTQQKANKDEKRQKSISEARAAASKVRWNNRLNTSDDQSAPLDDESAHRTALDATLETDSNVLTNQGEETENSSSLKVVIPPTSRTILRAKTKLLPAIPKNTFDGLKVFKRCYVNLGCDEKLIQRLQATVINEGAMTRGQINHKYRVIMKIFEQHRSCHDQLFQVWLEQITSQPTLENFMDMNNLRIPDAILPRSFSLSRIVRSEVKKLLSCSSKCESTSPRKLVGTQLVVKVAKAADLSPDHHGDISLLANAVSCGRVFAKKVLQAIKDNDEESLYERNTRCDSVLASDWPKKLELFVLEPENSRAVPGQDNISIRYGHRVPKYLLLKSKEDIIDQFKVQHPECEFSVRTLMREFPTYAVPPTTRDIERNSCPIHANARRVTKAINKVLRKNKKPTLSTSCKQLSLSIMCDNGSQTVSPLTWNKNCAYGECESCPDLKINIDETELTTQVNISQWKSKKQSVKDRKTGEMKEKYIFALYPETMSVKNAIALLQELLPDVRKHVFTAHNQWNAHKIYREHLDESSFITIEDYQMNIDPEYLEAPTSLSYSTNKKSFALYPVCIEYLEDGELKKGAISFISEDLKHDHQQVQRFEERLIQIVREKIRPHLVNWFRFSDGCGAQFKSRHCIADLFANIEKFQLSQAGFHLFESHEGKSSSDSIGSWVKCGIRRGMMKDENIVIKTAQDVVDVARSEVAEKTDKYTFSVIEPFDAFERFTERDELVIDGITQLHSFIVKDDKLYFATESCTNCRVHEMCADCAGAPPDADRTYILRGNNEDEVIEIESIVRDSEDDGKTDDDSDDEADKREENECIHIGDIVWGKHGRVWYPAKVVGQEEVPELVLQHLGRNLDGKHLVKWWGEDNFSTLEESKIEHLARNKIDELRANRSKHISKLYHQAVAETIDD